MKADVVRLSLESNGRYEEIISIAKSAEKDYLGRDHLIFSLGEKRSNKAEDEIIRTYETVFITYEEARELAYRILSLLPVDQDLINDYSYE